MLPVITRRVTFVPALAQRVAGIRHSSGVHGNDPDILAREKARNLKGTQDSSAPHKDHAPGWNEHLASHSEANVKADQAGPAGKPGKELQDATVAATHKHHHTEEGQHKGVEHHAARGQKAPTGSEDAVRADQGKH